MGVRASIHDRQIAASRASGEGVPGSGPRLDAGLLLKQLCDHGRYCQVTIQARYVTMSSKVCDHGWYCQAASAPISSKVCNSTRTSYHSSKVCDHGRYCQAASPPVDAECVCARCGHADGCGCGIWMCMWNMYRCGCGCGGWMWMWMPMRMCIMCTSGSPPIL